MKAITHHAHEWVQVIPLALHTLACRLCEARADMRAAQPFNVPRCIPQRALESSGYRDEGTIQ